ncbi:MULTISPECIES: hypothetical protein [Clostridium]|nr:hypothetical protein [Clostridium sporogenes]MBA4507691.1 hypothetical protein [Clostridium sporogenes]MBW5456307.1 hypothetical protein [Clostridium sporogenes]MCW6060393.1 hypothetical protein [Clostridium sporogenes]MCW6068244.1 hypothetical protein [Clostridium sporogenes]MCW6084519.1 hypothetical protein [Clostridium sporogenes]
MEKLALQNQTVTDIEQEAALNGMTKEDVSQAIEILDKAIVTISAEKGKLGAYQW